MACAVRNVTSVNYDTRTETDFTAPAGIQVGDTLLILLCVGATTSITPDTPDGFTPLANYPLQAYKSDPWYNRGFGYYKVAVSADTSTETYSVTLPISDEKHNGNGNGQIISEHAKLSPRCRLCGASLHGKAIPLGFCRICRTTRAQECVMEPIHATP